MISLTPSCGQPSDLGDDVGERAADLGAAHRRDDAERARVVAADLDGDPGVVRGLAPSRQGAGEHRLVVEHGLVEDLGDRPVDGEPRVMSSAVRCTLCVPSTTSTNGAF